MKKLFLCLMLFFSATASFATTLRPARDNDPLRYIVTGIVEKVSINALEIWDENDRIVKRYVYFGRDVEVGQRVRVHYDPASLRIDRLKKMTTLEYQKDGQNLGYIFQQENKVTQGAGP
ncbi:MAG TPA: hypothetical protein PKO44_02225 [Candidatus Omnitrophota bacterium]|nr:hypothetical protein [Candidatus Omnitrophota bacterium]